MRDRLRRGDTEIANTPGGRFAALRLTPEVGFGLTRGFSVGARAPLVRETFDENAPGAHRERTGLGDVELLAGYDAIRAPAIWRFALIAGLSLPTGTHEAQPLVGSVAPTPLQLGTGTVDPLAAVTVERRLGPAWSLDGSGAARLAVMENVHGYGPASLFEAGAGGRWRPARPLDIDLHAEWSHVTHVEIAGSEVPNTGRDALYVAPGASVRLWRSLTFGATVRVPVYLRVNETQFAEEFLVAVRLAYRTAPLF